MFTTDFTPYVDPIMFEDPFDLWLELQSNPCYPEPYSLPSPMPEFNPTGCMYSNPFMMPDLDMPLPGFNAVGPAIDMNQPHYLVSNPFRTPEVVAFEEMMGIDSHPHNSWQDAMHEENQRKLADDSRLTDERDQAVRNYHDAMDSGDYDAALRWESIANDRQGDLYNLWDTTTYGLPPKAPGL